MSLQDRMAAYGYVAGVTRIRLLHTSDPYTDLRSGDEGTVTFIDSMGTVSARWDNGSTLGLVPGEDLWEVIT